MIFPLFVWGRWFKESIDSSVRIGIILEQSCSSGADFVVKFVTGRWFPFRWFNDRHDVCICQMTLVYAICCTVRVCIRGWRQFRLRYLWPSWSWIFSMVSTSRLSMPISPINDLVFLEDEGILQLIICFHISFSFSLPRCYFVVTLSASKHTELGTS